MSEPLSSPAPPASVTEVRIDSPPALVHGPWRDEFPWLVQGCTTRGDGPEPFDLGIFSDASSPRHVLSCWERLGGSVDMTRTHHAHQVHGSEVRVHGAGEAGLLISEACDGHVTAEPGALLAVTTADCVPVFLLDPQPRAVGAVHAGWRGVAAGILERALDRMVELGCDVARVRLHLGPAICGDCYEVGPEVFEALEQEVPHGPTPIDLRAVLADRAMAAGVAREHLTVSTHCTRCTGSGLYSHRGGDRERQVGYIGVRS